jgi:hypothetical protein
MEYFHRNVTTVEAKTTQPVIVLMEYFRPSVHIAEVLSMQAMVAHTEFFHQSVQNVVAKTIAPQIVLKVCLQGLVGEVVEAHHRLL